MTRDADEAAASLVEPLMAAWTRRQILRRALTLGASLAVAPVALSCGEASSTGGASNSITASANPNSTLSKAMAAKSLRLGIFDGYPYSFLDPSGKPTGASVETMLGALEPLGIKRIDAVLVDFAGLIPGLVAGRYDAIAAGLYITKARCAQVAFGNPDMSMGDGFVVRKGNPKNLHSFADVARAGATFCTAQGTAELTTAKNAGVQDSHIQLVASNQDGMAAVSAGRVDCYATSSASVANLMKHDPPANVERATPFSDPTDASGQPVKGHPGAAFRMADIDLRDAYNQGLEKLIQSGQLLKNLEKFGLTQGEMPTKGVTVATLCG